MLKFFRNIRQNLIMENLPAGQAGKTTKYFKYAIGEIFLVVIGILIALQINNWNETNKDRKIESNYLVALKKELIADTTGLSLYVLQPFYEKENNLKLGRDYFKGNYQINDTIEFLNKIALAKSMWGFVWTLNTNVYSELKSTGNLQKINNPELRQDIARYYSRLDLGQLISDTNKSDYKKFINANLFYDNQLKKVSSTFDYHFLLNKLKTEEFYELCNLELAHNQIIYSWANNIKHQAKELLNSIDNYKTNEDD